MTKQPTEETALKCHLSIEEAKPAEANALMVCDMQGSPKLEGKLEVTPIRSGMESEGSKLGKAVIELYDLEEFVSEKPVKIDLELDLYQMEKV